MHGTITEKVKFAKAKKHKKRIFGGTFFAPRKNIETVGPKAPKRKAKWTPKGSIKSKKYVKRTSQKKNNKKKKSPTPEGKNEFFVHTESFF